MAVANQRFKLGLNQNNSVILKSGPASVIVKFLDKKDHLKLGQLCKRFYVVILPDSLPCFGIYPLRKCDDWLRWGDDKSQNLVISQNLNVDISGEVGYYNGECKVVKSKSIPHGRGLFDNGDKMILGYVEDGSWVFGTQRIVISS